MLCMLSQIKTITRRENNKETKIKKASSKDRNPYYFCCYYSLNDPNT